MKYVVWTVYDQPGLTRHYVVNNDTKEIQATWKKYLDAKSSCDKLNSEPPQGGVYDKRVELVLQGTLK